MTESKGNISAISSLGEFPNLLYPLFKTKNVPENGCVEIIIRIEGVWQIVCLDDSFPCDKNTKKPIFARSKTNELWPLFIEKAWAKVNCGYVNIISGNSLEVFQAFTPFNSVRIDTRKENKQNLWKNIRDADFNCIMTASIDDTVSIASKFGLVAGYSFSVVSAFERKVGEQT